MGQWSPVSSEGKVVEVGVVHVANKTAATRGAGWGAGRDRRGELAAVTVLAGALLEVHDAVGRDLERRPLLAVAAFELARLEAALDEHAVALAQVLRGPLGTVAPDADPEPVGLLDPLPGLLVLRALVDRDVELRHGPAAGRVPHLRIGAQVPDDHHLA